MSPFGIFRKIVDLFDCEISRCVSLQEKQTFPKHLNNMYLDISHCQSLYNNSTLSGESLILQYFCPPSITSNVIFSKLPWYVIIIILLLLIHKENSSLY